MMTKKTKKNIIKHFTSSLVLSDNGYCEEIDIIVQDVENTIIKNFQEHYYKRTHDILQRMVDDGQRI